MRSSIAASSLVVVLALATSCADFSRGDATAADTSADTGADTRGGDTAVIGDGSDTTDDASDGVTDDVPVTVTSFADDIHPVLLTACGQCHTSGAPRPFLLSNDPDVDYDGVVALLDFDDPPGSTLLEKGTGTDFHGGGPTLSTSSPDYQLILDWIGEAAPR